MRIVELQANNFKRLVAVEITPEGNVVEITGKNGSGKSSVLDAIYVALVGRSAAPPKPVRNGEEKCTIMLDLGELVVTRTFTVKEGAQFTDTLKVENSEGLRYGKPQEVLDALLGEIGFDPFEFCQMKPTDQADTLLGMVPLAVDLDEMAEQDQSDFLKRRDVNRDLVALKAQVAAIPEEKLPESIPDRAALLETLGNAADTNAAIERERARRDEQGRQAMNCRLNADNARAEAARLREKADQADAAAKEQDGEADRITAEIEGLEPLAEPVDTDTLRAQLAEADRLAASVERQNTRRKLQQAVKAAQDTSEALTAALEKREAERRDALAAAQMPIEGLGFQIDEKGRPLVTFGGVPFEQASTAEQLRASTAIAMAANPTLRVLRIKDGSLLDEDSMKLLGEMAKADDFQLFVERVGTGGVGVIMEDGMVKAAAEKKPSGKAKAEKPEGTLV